jgi:hypothetical protein
MCRPGKVRFQFVNGKILAAFILSEGAKLYMPGRITRGPKAEAAFKSINQQVMSHLSGGSLP